MISFALKKNKVFRSYSLHKIAVASESIVEVNAISTDIEGGLRGDKALQAQRTDLLDHFLACAAHTKTLFSE